MTNNDDAIREPTGRLVEIIAGYGRTAVALSGGVDSSVVAKAAYLASPASAIAITAQSASVSQAELEMACQIAQMIGIQHHLVKTDEFADPRYVANDGTRCYFCKSELYDQVDRLRAKLGFDVILSGANLDDRGDYRPGLQAAAEHKVRHPLQEAGFTKSLVRQAARFWNLPNWDKPAAPCLSSRIAVGVEATPERTARVEAAETFLKTLGLAELRVRYHAGDLARIEVPLGDVPRLAEPAMARQIADRFKEIGFKFVSLDLVGFQSGSLNVLVPADLLRGSIES
jgi:uncharacterized protein